MKIYTKTGDSGETGLYGGVRVSKAHARVAAYGDVDETNAALGLARASLVSAHSSDLAAMLEQIQRDLFALGARLADPAHRIADRVAKAVVSADDVRTHLLDQSSAGGLHRDGGGVGCDHPRILPYSSQSCRLRPRCRVGLGRIGTWRASGSRRSG